MTKLNDIGLRLAVMFRSLSLADLEREEGQTLAEYAMILALIALVVVLVVAFLGTTISSLFTKIASGI
jgi:pilus assembly protein Flp/PilA